MVKELLNEPDSLSAKRIKNKADMAREMTKLHAQLVAAIAVEYGAIKVSKAALDATNGSGVKTVREKDGSMVITANNNLGSCLGKAVSAFDASMFVRCKNCGGFLELDCKGSLLAFIESAKKFEKDLGE